MAEHHLPTVLIGKMADALAAYARREDPDVARLLFGHQYYDMAMVCAGVLLDACEVQREAKWQYVTSTGTRRPRDKYWVPDDYAITAGEVLAWRPVITTPEGPTATTETEPTP